MKEKKSVTHKSFKVGQGYGSGEKDSDAKEHPSLRQYGDNPLPPSGGNYRAHQSAKKKNRHHRAA